MRQGNTHVMSVGMQLSGSSSVGAHQVPTIGNHSGVILCWLDMGF